MKKFVIFTLIIAMVAGAAFAQLANGITVNAWGRGMFAPLRVFTAPQVNGETDDDAEATVTAGSGASWGGGRARVDFRINGATEYVGFVLASTVDNGLGSGDDGYNIWVKPFGNDMLKLAVGALANDTLRGKIGNLDGGFSNNIIGRNVPEEDQIFSRFAVNDVGGPQSVYGDGTHGFMLSSSPIDGLFFGILVPGARDPWWSDGVDGTTEAKDVYRFMQIGAGYNIDGIGHIRAQWIGGYLGTDSEDPSKDDYAPKDPSKPARIEAAFALTAVDNLLVDLGGKFWLPVKGEKSKASVSNGVDFSLGATFRMEAFNIGARVDAMGIASHARVNEDDESGNGLGVEIRLVPAYDFDFATLGLSLGAKIKGKDKGSDGDAVDGTNAMQFGFGLFLGKSLAGGSLKGGLSFTTAPMNSDGATGSAVFQIPIILEYAFF